VLNNKSNSQKTFICDFDGCDKKYSNSSHLNRHKKSHETKPVIASISCKQPNCRQMFTNKSNMNRHYKTHHINTLPYSCQQCDEKFRRKHQLKKHLIQKHTGEYPHKCQHCKKGFINVFSLTRHMTIHNEEKKRSCADCEETFDKWSQLVDHRRKTHKNDLRFSCDICGKFFFRKINIKQHMRVHLLPSDSDDVFLCHYENCPNFYSQKRNLLSHIRSKHECKRWSCDLCQRELATKQKLEQHIKAHLSPTGRKRLNKKKSALSKVIGVELDQKLEHKIMKGEQVDLPIVPQLPAESSCTELSDF
jgi:hypothetical protein